MHGEAQLTVQPDFELFVSRDISLDRRWKVERMADLVQRDVVFRYRITREAVYRGLKWGATQKEMFGFLRRNSVRPLPQNVVHDLETWANQYGDISFAEVLLMRCSSEKVAQELRVCPEIAPLIRGSIGPKDLIISRNDHDRIVRNLERNGYLPKPGIVTFDEEEPSA